MNRIQHRPVLQSAASYYDRILLSARAEVGFSENIIGREA